MTAKTQKRTEEKKRLILDACYVLHKEMGTFAREDVERKTGLSRSTSHRYLQKLVYQKIISYDNESQEYSVKA